MPIGAVNEVAHALQHAMGVVTPDHLAMVLSVTPETLREWRRLKQGPDFVRVGKGVMYRITDIQDWMKRNVVPTVRG